jgi:hypothetical protein
MARLARDLLVLLVERHTRLRRVVPLYGRPRRRPMALLALGAKACLESIVLPANPVTVVTGVWRALVLAVQVARLASQGLMLAIKPERGRVVERAVRGVELSSRRAREERNGAEGDDEDEHVSLHGR